METKLQKNTNNAKKLKKLEGIAKNDEITRNYYIDSFRRLRKSKVSMICLAIITIVALTAIFAPFIATHDPYAIDLDSTLKTPSASHWLGTDEFGRDIFSRLVYGSRISMLVGLVAVGISMIIGLIFGIIAGYYGGIIDIIISRFIEILMAFPGLLFALAIVFALGPSIFNVFIAIGFIGWTGLARIIRGQVMQLKEKEYIEACKASGGSGLRVIIKHIIPNCIPLIIVMATMGIPGAIVGEAGLSFIGMGAQPPTASWGAMINASGPYLRSHTLYSIIPGLAIAITVLAFNIFGDGLRDAMDPRLKN